MSKFPELDKLHKLHQHSMKVPDDPPCYCLECGWEGKVSDCPTEPEPIGFMEGPWYDMAVCPACGGGIEI